MDGDGNAAELERSTRGVFVGGDTLLENNSLRLGALAGYSQADFDSDTRLASAQVDSYHLSVYGGGEWNRVNLRAGLAYGWHQMDTERSVMVGSFTEQLAADYKANTLQGFAELGLSYTGLLASDADQHGVLGNVTLRF